MATKRPVVGDPTDARGMNRAIRDYVEALRVSNYSEYTAHVRTVNLTLFSEWMEARGLTRPAEVTKPIVERYQRALYHRRKPDGKPLTFGSQTTQLMSLKSFFRWLARQNRILYNPASELEMPRVEKRLPRDVLTIAEVEAVLGRPDVTTLNGLRDRTMMEVLYSTGIRRMELMGLSLYDLDAERGVLMVRQGKGRKDRMVPIGDRALAWCERYLDEVRPRWALEPDDGSFFLTNDGARFSPNRLTQLVRDYVKAAALGKRGSCHLFRHTCATLMLEGGADIRFIQQLLGHADIGTTQIYTQVSIRKLQQIHRATHPSALTERRRETGLTDPPATAEELAAELAREAAEEDDLAATG
jgi:integrase/recombinase XerD